MAEKKTVGAAKKYVLPDGLMRLHIQLGNVTQEDSDSLKKYGNVKRGFTITRDIIVPDEMPLRSLHYVIQRAFGFQDSHEHMFSISPQSVIDVAGDNMGNLLNLRGVIFHYLGEMDDDFYCMDIPMFTGGNFNKWMQKQYTGPYTYDEDFLQDYHGAAFEDDEEYEDDYLDDYMDGHPVSSDDLYYIVERVSPSGEKEQLNRAIISAEDIESIEEPGEHVKLEEEENGWMATVRPVRCDANDPDACTLKKVRLGDLSVEDGFLAIQDQIIQLIERLKIGDVLAVSDDNLPFSATGKAVNPVSGIKHPQIVTDEQIQNALDEGEEIDVSPFTDEIMYTYDFGDGWQFFITGSRGYSDLIEEKAVTPIKADRAVTKALKMQRPVVLAADGDMLIEDVGNIEGYAAFIEHMRLAPDAVIEEGKNEYDQGKYRGNWAELQDEDDIDDDGMTRAENLEWAISQGWHRNDYTNYNLL